MSSRRRSAAEPVSPRGGGRGLSGPTSGSGNRRRARSDLEPDALGRAAGDSLGRRIADLRSARGWTQQDLAERLGISRVAVSHLEAGMSDPSERTVALLAGAFHVEPHDLVEGTNYPMAKVERLPLVVARYTEVEHQLALLERDLAWLDLTGSGCGADVLTAWDQRLTELLHNTHDTSERRLVEEASRIVRTRRRA